MSDPRPPRVVATDCDGTLLRSDGTVSAYTRDVLDAVARRGVVVVLVTARPPRWLDELSDLGVSGLALCGNGAFTYDLATRQIVGRRFLEAELLGELLTDLRRELPGITLATESHRGFAREHDFERASGRRDGEWLVGDLAQLAAEPAGKILVRHPEWGTEELSARIARVVDGRAEVAHSGAVQMGEITAPGVTKALALSHWCADQDPPVDAADVWAFGDMPNDLPMLAWAGRSHAVAGGHPDVLEIADHVIPGNDEDGVARTLEDAILRASQG